jgi:hypothetical protein
MKNIMITNILTLFLLTACVEQGSVTQSGGSTSGTTTEDTISGGSGSTDGGTGAVITPPGTGTTCNGSTADGEGAGVPIHNFNLFLAGYQTWEPGDYNNSLQTQVMPTLQEAVYLFQSDSRLRVRFKVKTQPNPGYQQEYCHGRTIYGPADMHNYTKLKAQVSLRDIKCNTPDPSNTNACSSGFYLGSSYATQIIDPIDVGECGQIMELGHLRTQNPYGTVVAVNDVKSDSTCQANGTQCPSEEQVRSQVCWHMTMQVVTDSTQDFK